MADNRKMEPKPYLEPSGELAIAAEPVVKLMGREQLEKLIKTTEKQMEAAAKDLDFLAAARLRDEIAELKKMLKKKQMNQ